MRKRDLMILCAACLAIFLSLQYKNGIFLKEVFRRTTDPTPSSPACENLHLAKPVVVDLDEDGDNEIVMATNDYRIVVLEATEESSGQSYGNFGYSVKMEASVLGTVKVKKGRKPISIAVAKLSSRSRNVIVVLTDGWVVLCYSYSLRLEWETHILEDMPLDFPTGFVSDATIQILPFPVRVSDLGTVIIAGRIIPTSSDSLSHQHKQLDPRTASLFPTENNQELLKEINEDIEEEEHKLDWLHFSYYALDGRTGSKRWKHEREDFQEVDYTKFYQSSSSQFSSSSLKHAADSAPSANALYRDYIMRESKHLGQRDWEEFRDQIMNHLPYRWRGFDDTHLELDAFQKQRSFSRKQDGSGSSASSWSSEAMGISPEQLPSFVSGQPKSGNTNKPGSKIDSNVQSNVKVTSFDNLNANSNSIPAKKPNVFVAYHSEGIEVIHLYTGFTLCSLPFESEERAVIWDDLNDDLIIDQIEAFSGRENALVLSETEKSLGCMTIVRTGPSFEQELFNGSICYETNYLKKLKKDSQYFENQPQPSHVTVTAPITFEQPNSDYKSIVYLVSNGKLTSYKSNGRQQWQIQTKSIKSKFIENFYLDLFSLPTDHFSPAEEYILATGEWITVVDKDGNLVAEHHVLPPFYMLGENSDENINMAHQLASKPLIADFNNDHLNDIIVITCNSYIGYRFEEESTSILFQAFLLGMFVTLLLLIIKNISTDPSGSLQSPSPSPLSSTRVSKELGGLNKQH